MFGTIRKHQAWLWGIIVTLTVISLFGFFNPGSRGGGRSENGPDFGKIEGRNITLSEFQEARNEAELGYFLNKLEWPDVEAKNSGFNLEEQTYQQIFWIQKMKDFDVEINDAAIAEVGRLFLRRLSMQTQERREITPEDFAKVLAQRRMSMDDFRRYCEHYVGFMQMFSIIGLDGQLVPPQEARLLYEREHKARATQAAFFTYSNYLGSVTGITAQAVAQFYTNQAANYREPDRVQVAYVSFNVSNYLAQAEHENTNWNTIVDTNIRRLGTNYVLYGKTVAEARTNILARLVRKQAMDDATAKASEFTTELLAMEPPRPGNLTALAQTKKLPWKITAPFDEQAGPVEFDGGPNFAKIAFALVSDEPFSEQPLVGEDAVYVIALNNRIPSGTPPLDQIRDHVAADYKRIRAVELAHQAAAKFEVTVTNGLAHGKTFASLCAEEKITPVTPPPVYRAFTNEVPEIEEHLSLMGAGGYVAVALSATPGKAVLGYSHDGAYVLYVQRELPVNEARMRADMPDFLKTVRQVLRQEAVNEWFNREYPRAMRESALFRAGPDAKTPGVR
jgi:hypothetical protein